MGGAGARAEPQPARAVGASDDRIANREISVILMRGAQPRADRALAGRLAARDEVDGGPRLHSHLDVRRKIVC